MKSIVREQRGNYKGKRGRATSATSFAQLFPCTRNRLPFILCVFVSLPPLARRMSSLSTFLSAFRLRTCLSVLLTFRSMQRG
jgi:hypothetical protein